MLLSPREAECLSLLACGKRPQEIAVVLNTHPKTVEKQIASARRKLGARTREHAVARALALGLVGLPDGEAGSS